MGLGGNNSDGGEERDVGSCKVCSERATLRCSGCYKVFYCSQEHQKEDWKKSHKKTCAKPYTVKENKLVGRYMVAARDLNPGELILREKSVVHGPNLDKSPPICVVCYKLLREGENFRPCDKCQVPLCSKGCSLAESHSAECEVLKRCPQGFYNKFDQGRMLVSSKPSLQNANFQIIIPLRTLLLKKQNLAKYRSLMTLESHWESRKGTEMEKRVDETIVKLLHQYHLHDLADRDLVQKICGIFDTNSFDLVGSEAEVNLAGIFPSAAMMMHSCIKNTRITLGSDHSMTIFARELIRAGEPIYHCYTPVLNPTNIRRLMLFTGKNFSCECSRCKDPAEMGAFTSALKCSDCPGGTILPENPIDLASTWRCTKCGGGTRAGGDVAMLERRVSMEIQGLDSKDIAGMESLLAQYSEVFDPRHALMLKVKQMLSVGYGRFDCTMQTLKEKKLKRKVELCREVVAGLKILETGIAARRGYAAYELSKSLSQLAKNQLAAKCGKAEYAALMAEALHHLETATEIMAFDPKDTFYGALAMTANKELKEMQKTFAELN